MGTRGEGALATAPPPAAILPGAWLPGLRRQFQRGGSRSRRGGGQTAAVFFLAAAACMPSSQSLCMPVTGPRPHHPRRPHDGRGAGRLFFRPAVAGLGSEFRAQAGAPRVFHFLLAAGAPGARAPDAGGGELGHALQAPPAGPVQYLAGRAAPGSRGAGADQARRAATSRRPRHAHHLRGARHGRGAHARVHPSPCRAAGGRRRCVAEGGGGGGSAACRGPRVWPLVPPAGPPLEKGTGTRDQPPGTALLPLAVCGPCLLFFGCRNAAKDWLYAEEWEELTRAGVLTGQFLAASRDQAHKIYVQDRIRGAGAQVATLLTQQGKGLGWGAPGGGEGLGSRKGWGPPPALQAAGHSLRLGRGTRAGCRPGSALEQESEPVLFFAQLQALGTLTPLFTLAHPAPTPLQNHPGTGRGVDVCGRVG